MTPDYGGRAVTGPWAKPWLIQRLRKAKELPEGHMLRGKDNPFNFGGGLRDGGFSKEAMDMFRPIFSFDYMGSAEFEFGAVPKAFSSIFLSVKDFVGTSFRIRQTDVAWSEWDARYFRKPEHDLLRNVFLYAHRSHLESAEKFIRSLVGKKEPDLKEGALFSRALLDPKNQEEPWLLDIQGWIDLNNCLMFFTDQGMFEKTKALFDEAEKSVEKTS